VLDGLDTVETVPPIVTVAEVILGLLVVPKTVCVWEVDKVVPAVTLEPLTTIVVPEGTTGRLLERLAKVTDWPVAL